MAFSPRSGVPECALRPNTRRCGLRQPLCAETVISRVGSPTTTRSRWCPLAANALAPVLPISSSATNTIVSRPRQAWRASISRRTASTMAATHPLASHAPRPISRPSASRRLKGSPLQPGPAGTTSRCELNPRDGPSPFSKTATRLRRPGATAGVATSQPSCCRIPARKLRRRRLVARRVFGAKGDESRQQRSKATGIRCAIDPDGSRWFRQG